MLRERGPVLSSDELDLYGVELKDHENCVGVPGGRWTESLQQLARIDQRDLIRMRSNVRAMVENNG